MWSRREARSSLSRQLHQLRTDFDAISDNMNRLRASVRNETSALADYIPAFASGLPSLASGRLAGLGHAASNGADAMAHQAEALMDAASRQIRDKPVPAGLALLGLGLALAYFLRKI